MLHAEKKSHGTLLKETMRLLKKTRLSHAEIVRATGLDAAWLSRLCNGTTRDPSVNKIETLYTYLSGKEIL
jgi:transcriptional regulator with XRE-family HTH domain